MHGSVAERPWGQTLAALAAGERTAQLVLRADDKTFAIDVERGVVVGASSPLAADSVTRVALTSHHITPGQVNDVRRRLALAPTLDEVDVLAAAVQLTTDQARTLRTRLWTQRAARTFAVERGDYEIIERAPLPLAPEVEVDLRSVIFTGARMYLSDDRLAVDLRALGSRFALKTAALDDLPRYGFGRADRPILDALMAGTSLPELDASHREIDPRAVQAVVYALGACDALELIDEAVPVAETHRAETVRGGVPRSMIETFKTGKLTTVRPNPLAAHEVVQLIGDRLALLDTGGDHFALLGLPVGAPIEDVHAAYVELSRYLRPARLAELGISDGGFGAQRLLAQLGIAFTVLTDRVRRPAYIASLASLASPRRAT